MKQFEYKGRTTTFNYKFYTKCRSGISDENLTFELKCALSLKIHTGFHIKM